MDDNPEDTMPTWIPAVVVPFVAILTNLAAQFYFKLVPDIKDQKRHLKQTSFWAMDILGICVQVGCVAFFFRSNSPVTPQFVVLAAWSMSCLFFYVAQVGYRRQLLDGILKRNLERIGKLTDIDMAQIGLLTQHRRALEMLANDTGVSSETAEAVRDALSGGPSMADAGRTLSPRESPWTGRQPR